LEQVKTNPAVPTVVDIVSVIIAARGAVSSGKARVDPLP
jgi:hypothetical protein